MSDSLNRIIANIPMPPGAVPTEAVVVVGYLDSDGDPSYHVRTGGECPMSTILGLLEMGKHQLLHSANPTPCEREERRPE